MRQEAACSLTSKGLPKNIRYPSEIAEGAIPDDRARSATAIDGHFHGVYSI
jgi:hypothetical protein